MRRFDSSLPTRKGVPAHRPIGRSAITDLFYYRRGQLFPIYGRVLQLNALIDEMDQLDGLNGDTNPGAAPGLGDRPNPASRDLGKSGQLSAETFPSCLSVRNVAGGRLVRLGS